jgi:hypothetical protein
VKKLNFIIRVCKRDPYTSNNSSGNFVHYITETRSSALRCSVINTVTTRECKINKKHGVLGRTNRLLSLIRHSPHIVENDASNNSSIVACVFVTTETYTYTLILAKRPRRSRGAHNSGYGEWHRRGTRATQCLGV